MCKRFSTIHWNSGSKLNESTYLDDYEALVKEAKTSNPKIILPKLPLPEEFVDSPQTINEADEVNAEDSSDEDLNLSLNKQSSVTRSGRISKFPSRYADNY